MQRRQTTGLLRHHAVAAGGSHASRSVVAGRIYLKITALRGQRDTTCDANWRPPGASGRAARSLQTLKSLLDAMVNTDGRFVYGRSGFESPCRLRFHQGECLPTRGARGPRDITRARPRGERAVLAADIIAARDIRSPEFGRFPADPMSADVEALSLLLRHMPHSG